MRNGGDGWSGLFIGIGIFLGALMLKAGITSIKESQRIISVKGLSEKEVSANKVVWPIVFKDAQNNLIYLYNNIERNNEKVVNFLKENGITDDEITVSPPDILDYQTERYSDLQSRYRYNGTSVITVTSDKVDQVRELILQITVLIKDGVALSGNRSYENPIKYEFTQLNLIKPEMIEEATKNARISAEKFAKDSESSLGKIKSATQGQMSIFNSDENSPHIKTVRVVTTITYFLKD
ncbi:MAG: SIMPL domain-containing protein [Dysgonamonadaceae bacterium]|jgi:hypothetical protein|nr:SIMPL domain-containing protein [Dysgonamonadaceae bacterium]